MKVALSCANSAENRSSQTRSPEFIAAGRDLWRSGWVTWQSTDAAEGLALCGKRARSEKFFLLTGSRLLSLIRKQNRAHNCEEYCGKDKHTNARKNCQGVRRISGGFSNMRELVVCKSQQYSGENPTSILVNKSFRMACSPG